LVSRKGVLPIKTSFLVGKIPFWLTRTPLLIGRTPLWPSQTALPASKQGALTQGNAKENTAIAETGSLSASTSLLISARDLIFTSFRYYAPL
jgi:hypothetical protein